LAHSIVSPSLPPRESPSSEPEDVLIASDSAALVVLQTPILSNASSGSLNYVLIVYGYITKFAGAVDPVARAYAQLMEL
jgi:hypothetical protein